MLCIVFCDDVGFGLAGEVAGEADGAEGGGGGGEGEQDCRGELVVRGGSGTGGFGGFEDVDGIPG